MIDSPFDINEPKPLDGMLAVAFLFFVPFGGGLFGWLGTFLGAYQIEVELFGSLDLYYRSVGFRISGLRQPVRSVRIRAASTLLFDLDIILNLHFSPLIL